MGIYKIHTSKSIYGLSVDTQASYLLAVISRCVWEYETRLNETKLAYVELVASTGAAFFLCYLCLKHMATTTQHSPAMLSVKVSCPVCLVLSFFFHPGDGWASMQILVSYTMFQEAFGLVPQLYLMRKMHEVEPLTSHYVGLIVMARIIRMLFWAKMYLLGEHFLLLFFADICHTLLSADYLLLWCRKLKNGGHLIYSQSQRF